MTSSNRLKSVVSFIDFLKALEKDRNAEPIHSTHGCSIVIRHWRSSIRERGSFAWELYQAYLAGKGELRLPPKTKVLGIRRDFL